MRYLSRHFRRNSTNYLCLSTGAMLILFPFATYVALVLLLWPIGFALLGAGIGGFFRRFGAGAVVGTVMAVAVIVVLARAAGRFRRGSPSAPSVAVAASSHDKSLIGERKDKIKGDILHFYKK